MEHKRLTKAIQEHVWNGEKWPGLCDHGDGKSASEIASNIIRETQRMDNELFPSRNEHGRLADMLSYCIEFVTTGQYDEYDDPLPYSALARVVGRLSLIDSASTLHIIHVVSSIARRRYSPEMLLRWEREVSWMGPLNLETLLGGDMELAVPIWIAQHLQLPIDEQRLKGKFGIDFMERMIFEHGDQCPAWFWEDAIKGLPCWVVCRLLKSLVCCSSSLTVDGEHHHLPGNTYPRNVDDLVQGVRGFRDNSYMTMAILIARYSELYGFYYPSIDLLYCILFGDESTLAVPRDELNSEESLSSALVVMHQLNDSGLTTWQLADVCSANPGWMPFQSDFDCVVQKYKTKVSMDIRSALSRPPENSRENVARMVLGFLVNDQ